MPPSSILILGGGCFGLSAALELRARGWRVTLLDQGPMPHPDAASTDISKVVRMDYGADEQHTAMGELSLKRWREWNVRWGEDLYHETGFLVMSPQTLQPGGFEHDSWRFLTGRGHELRRTSPAILRELHPAWNHERYQDGYLNPAGGWVESGRVMARLAGEARAAGVEILESVSHPRLRFEGSVCVGVSSADRTWSADHVLVAAGAWTPELVPPLRDVMWATAQTVLHFRPHDPETFLPPRFPVWGADMGRTGWYGFPANRDGIVKVANHGPGRRVKASDDPRRVPPEDEPRFRSFLAATFPDLAKAPVQTTRVCLYCDTRDGAFWIDHALERPGLIVAAGDSGHAFKFTPILGELIADIVERRPNPWAERYRWREMPQVTGVDGARAPG